MIALLDSNIWVSTFLNPKGFPSKLVKIWLSGKFDAVLSSFIIDEIRHTLNAPRIKNKYSISEEEIEKYIELILLRCITVFPMDKIRICRDVRDNHILEAALLGKAEFIVTRDDDIKNDLHLIKEMESMNIRIMSVNRFLNIVS